MRKIRSLKTFELPGLPGLISNDYVIDGYAGRIIERYTSIVVNQVRAYTNRNVKETCRILGWTEQQLRDELLKQQKRKHETSDNS